MKNNILYNVLAAAVLLGLASCEKVSPSGILIGNTSVDDRAKMSYEYFANHKGEFAIADSEGEAYSFLVGSDSHLATDDGRLREMFQNSFDHKDLLCCHCGDIADTTPENYIRLEKLMDEYNAKCWKELYDYDAAHDIYYYKRDRPEQDKIPVHESVLQSTRFPLFSCVGNHDITRNGWALFSNIFHSSFFPLVVVVDENTVDIFAFLDSAAGTLGKYQVEKLDEVTANFEQWGIKIRNTFFFTHTNIFRPRLSEFSSTFPREETYYLLNKFSECQASLVFLGHVHKFDDRVYGGVRYITLDAMSERNSPNPGEYLERVHVAADGTVTCERVMMNYVAK